MAIFKNSLIFSVRTGDENSLGDHAGGWTESYYSETDQSVAGSKFRRFAAKRGSLLSKICNIVALRFADVENPGIVKVERTNIPGTYGESGDVPQMALRITGQAVGTGNKLNLVWRGLPDDVVIAGELDRTKEAQKKFDLLSDELTNFYQPVRNLKSPKAPIDQIDNAGVVTCLAPLVGVAANDFVRIIRTRQDGRVVLGGRYKVQGVAGLVVTLVGWQGGPTYGGTIRKDQMTQAFYPEDMKVAGVMVRKVGRPLFQYRGKRSNRA